MAGVLIGFDAPHVMAANETNVTVVVAVPESMRPHRGAVMRY